MRALSMFGLTIALAGGAASSAMASSQYTHPMAYADPGQVVRCESTDGRMRRCGIDAAGGVQLLRQLSSTPCIAGQSWGADHDGIWVNDGCRGEFRGGSRGMGRRALDAQTLRCESPNGRQRLCAVDARGGARLIRQLSGAACIEGSTWGTNRDGLWVDRGCRGEFEVGSAMGHRWAWGRNGFNSGEPAYGGGGAAQTLRCESTDGRTQRCGVSARGVRLQRQLSESLCQQGQTWGWDPSGIWVSGGCRGEFGIW